MGVKTMFFRKRQRTYQSRGESRGGQGTSSRSWPSSVARRSSDRYFLPFQYGSGWVL